MVLVMDDVSNSLKLSSMDIVTTWFPVTGENWHEETDLEWPRISLTGVIILVTELVPLLKSKMQHRPLLLQVMKRLVFRGWIETDFGAIISKSLYVFTGLAQLSLLSTSTTDPAVP